MSDGCEEMRLLIQADLDGELAPAEAARVAAHLEHCPACMEVQRQLAGASARLRAEMPYYRAPDALRAAVRARVAGAPQPVAAPTRPARFWRRPGAPFAAGFALAACLALAMVLPGGTDLTDSVVASHIRALQPGHLMDVVSTDQHTVKPWFDGRVDFAPPVPDFKAQGFPLAGGRMDYLAGRVVAALVYRHDQHIIDVYVWPDAAAHDAPPRAESHDGYNTLRWHRGGMEFWAVSDVGATDLAAFARLWPG